MRNVVPCSTPSGLVTASQSSLQAGTRRKCRLLAGIAPLSLGLAGALVLGAAVSGRANTTYNDGAVHNITGDATGTIYVSGPSSPTTLNVLPGAYVSGTSTGIEAMTGGLVNVNGGMVTAGAYAIYNSNGMVSISAGTLTGADGVYNYQGTLAISGGTITGGKRVNINQGTVTISGGTITGGIGVVGAEGVYLNSGTLNIRGGTITGGGQPGYAAPSLYTNGGAANIFGSEFNYGYGPLSNTRGTLTGTLADGTPLNFPFSQHVSGTIVLHTGGTPANLDGNNLGGYMVTTSPTISGDSGHYSSTLDLVSSSWGSVPVNFPDNPGIVFVMLWLYGTPSDIASLGTDLGGFSPETSCRRLPQNTALSPVTSSNLKYWNFPLPPRSIRSTTTLAFTMCS